MLAMVGGGTQQAMNSCIRKRRPVECICHVGARWAGRKCRSCPDPKDSLEGWVTGAKQRILTSSLNDLCKVEHHGVLTGWHSPFQDTMQNVS